MVAFVVKAREEAIVHLISDMCNGAASTTNELYKSVSSRVEISLWVHRLCQSTYSIVLMSECAVSYVVRDVMSSVVRDVMSRGRAGVLLPPRVSQNVTHCGKGVCSLRGPR